MSPPRLRRLLYASRATAPDRCDAAALRAIADRAQAHNRQEGITGFLVYSAPFFFQFLEGAPTALTRLFGRIVADPRHMDCVIILDLLVPRRLYADWAMKVSDMQSLALHPTIATVLRRFGASFLAMWPYLPGHAASLLVEGRDPIREPPAQVQVVTAFVHLVEFPALVRRAAGGDFLPDVLELFVDTCAHYVRESGGTIAKFIHGTCMAYWPAEAALEAITAVQHVAARFKASRETEPSWSPLSLLHTAAGLHFGGALLCNVGQRKSDFTLLGDSINTTARIASLALLSRRPLLLSAALAALLGDRSRLHSAGTYPLRGREGGVECFHFNEPQIPLASIHNGIEMLCLESPRSRYRPRHRVRLYDDLPADDVPPLFSEFKVHAAANLLPRSSSFVGQAAFWAVRSPTRDRDLMTLTYLSRTAAVLSYLDVQAIALHAGKRNQQAGITSCLLHIKDALVHTLEGPTSAVCSLWQRIRADPRHTDVVAVHVSALPHRQHKLPLQVIPVNDSMLADFPALPDILAQLARSFLCLETYVPSVVVRHIAAGEDPRSLQPVRVSVAMLAADICSFTSLSEGCPLRAVLDVCNAFIEGCTSAIVASGGEVLKLIGDCVVAYFPSTSVHAALAAAEGLVRNCEQVRQKYSASLAGDNRALLWTGVGLDWGPVVVAHCGSLGAADLMVMGEVSTRVLAVEAATREERCAIVASDPFVAHLAHGDELMERVVRDIDGVPLHRRRGPQWALDPAAINAHIRQLQPTGAVLVPRRASYLPGVSRGGPRGPATPRAAVRHLCRTRPPGLDVPPPVTTRGPPRSPVAPLLSLLRPLLPRGDG
eukprot:EG_transcript_2089